MGLLGGTSKTEFGDELRDWRNGMNLTQYELAGRLDVSERTIQHWEAGTRLPSHGMQNLIWMETGISVGEEAEFDHEQRSFARDLERLRKG